MKKPASTKKRASTPKPASTKKQTLVHALKIFLLLLWVFVSIVIGQAFVSTILYYALGDAAYYDPLWTTIRLALGWAFTCLLVIYLPKKFKKLRLTTNREELGLTGLPRWRDIGLAIAGFAAYFILAGLFLTIFTGVFPWFDPTEAQTTGYIASPDLWGRIFTFVGLVLVAPIAEEVIFRGWLYAKVRRHASIWVAVILVSLLFAIAHSPLAAAINVFAMSIVMCLLRELTGTIHASIILHILKNAIAFYLLLYTGIL